MAAANDEQWLDFWDKAHDIVSYWETTTRARILGVTEARILAERIARALAAEYSRSGDESAQQLQRLAKVARALATPQDPATLVDIVAASAMELLGADGCVLFAPEENGTHLRVVAAYGPFPGLPVPMGQGAAGQAFVSGSPIIIEDYASWQGGLPELRSLSLGTCVAMPLVVAGRSRGCLSITFERPRACAQECLHTLTVLAGLCAPLLYGIEPTDTATAAPNTATADPTPEARAARLLSLELSNLLSRRTVVLPESPGQPVLRHPARPDRRVREPVAH
jgi:hypothetical protein